MVYQRRDDDVGENITGQTYSVEFDWQDDGFCEYILTGVEEVGDVAKDELPPLHTVVDVDALFDVFRPRVNGNERDEGTVSFPFAGCHVTLHASGLLVVSESGS